MFPIPSKHSNDDEQQNSKNHHDLPRLEHSRTGQFPIQEIYKRAKNPSMLVGPNLEGSLLIVIAFRVN
jgi:hypothetical protein